MIFWTGASSKQLRVVTLEVHVFTCLLTSWFLLDVNLVMRAKNLICAFFFRMFVCTIKLTIFTDAENKELKMLMLYNVHVPDETAGE